MTAPDGILGAFSLAGKKALVTGAGRGIGRSIATGLASAGAEVCLLSRNADELASVRDAITSVGGTAFALPVDLGVERMADVVDSAERLLGGRVEVVVHSAGTQHREPAVTFPEAEWERVLRVNLTAPFLLSQEVGRRQLEHSLRGSHVFVASLTSVLGLPDIVAYNAAKSGLMGVVRALSREWAASGIRVNAVSPGYVETAMTRDLFADPEKRAALLARIPMKAFGTPDQLAAPSVFLASEAAGYMTGQLLIVDGGWQAS